MGNKILKWNNDNCLIEYRWFSKNIKVDEWPSQCWFDAWSVIHFILTSVIYLVILFFIHLFVKKNKVKWALVALIILNVLHTIEDILENAEMFSIEYILWQLFDHDSFQNFVGDILSGLVGSVIIFILYAKMIK
uniref:Uncharacterized protein n=1 Tax=Mimivirus LCMiAC01 TaxID=2506608 RepID=A0A481Z1G5_9VIRU|nr:MAG: hypothetical protein LCMiAC01_02130 [Mimivirus LCMiAC01]